MLKNNVVAQVKNPSVALSTTTPSLKSILSITINQFFTQKARPQVIGGRPQVIRGRPNITGGRPNITGGRAFEAKQFIFSF